MAQEPSIPAHGAICLIREGGMGDVLMALAAAKALKAHYRVPLLMLTSAAFRGLAEACRHIDQVFTDRESYRAGCSRFPAGSVSVADLSAPAFSIAQTHQVDAYLRVFRMHAAAPDKELELRVGEQEQSQADAFVAGWPAPPQGKARILLHPALGNPNRTWPRSQWEALARALLEAGHRVAVIGHRIALANRSVQELAVPGLHDALDRLEPLATVALMRRCDLLVCSDSGPVQLAGASDIAIVGLYSVVAAANRLPFRHGEAGWRAIGVGPSCPVAPCYEKMLDPALNQTVNRAIGERRIETGTVFAEWCLVAQRYRCMQEEISVAAALRACQELLDQRPTTTAASNASGASPPR